MKKLPNVFKPDINHYLDNNKEVYYSYIEQKKEIPSNQKKEKNLVRNNNIKVVNLLKNDNLINKRVIIKTNDNQYETEILSKMGNNIIISNGKVISIFDIDDIYSI